MSVRQYQRPSPIVKKRAFTVGNPYAMALLIALASIAGCSGGGAGSASGSSCGGSGSGGNGTVYPANVAYSVPFSSPDGTRGTLDFPALAACQQVYATASASAPSKTSEFSVPTRGSVLEYVTVNAASSVNSDVPNTITLTFPHNNLSDISLSVYQFSYGGWQNIEYSGTVVGNTVTLTSDLLRYDVLGDNYFAIATE